MIKHLDLIQEVTASNDDASIIIYFAKGIPIHAGKYNKGGVLSKWDRGPIFRHEPLMVPSSYGSNIKYYHISNPELVKLFLHSFRVN